MEEDSGKHELNKEHSVKRKPIINPLLRQKGEARLPGIEEIEELIRKINEELNSTAPPTTRQRISEGLAGAFIIGMLFWIADHLSR